MRTTTTIIRQLNESSTQVLKGWFVHTESGKAYDISSDGGGGHHAGYTEFMQANYPQFNLSKEEADILYHYFIDDTDWETTHHAPNGMMVGSGIYKLYPIIRNIYNEYFRVIIMSGSNVFITVLDSNKDTLRKVVDFVIKYQNINYCQFWIDTYDDRPICAGVTLNELMEAVE